MTSDVPRPGVETVLVLGGGGGRGAAQLGVLRALAERGVVPDAVVGTSVGALNATAIAALPFSDAVDALEEIWRTPQTRAIFRSELARVAINRVRRRPWLRSGQCIADLVDFALDYIGIAAFDELCVPLDVIVTNLVSGAPHIVNSGSLRAPLTASCSIPGVFPPVALDGKFYVDGGVTENCSLATAASMNPGRIIAIDMSADAPGALTRFSDVMGRVIQVAQHARVVADFDRFSPRLPVTLICPNVSFNSIRFGDFGALMANARAATDALLQRITGPDGVLPSGVFYMPVTADNV